MSRYSTIFLFLTLAFLTFYNFSPETVFFTNDAAQTFAVASLAFKGKLTLLGPPASLGGRHIGPAYYWYQNIVMLIVGGDSFRACVVDSIFKSFTIFTAILILAKAWGFKSNTRFFLFTALILLAGDWWWVIRVPWHSNFVSCLSFLTFSTICLSFKKEKTLLPLILTVILGLSHNAAIPAAGVYLLALAANSYLKMERQLLNRKLILLLITAFLFIIYFKNNIVISLLNHLKADNILINAENSLELFYQFFFLNIANHIPSFAGFLVVIPWGVYILIKNFSSLIYVRKGSLILLISLPLAYAFSLVFISPQLHFLNTIRLVPLLFIALSAVLVVEQEKKLKLLQGLYLFLCGIIICPAIYANLSKFSYFPYATVNSLRHAEEVANIIKQDEYFTKDTTVRTAKKKQERQNAYLYFLGEDYFSKMDNAKKFSEFSEFDFSNQADCNNVYLISCEGEDSRELITKRLLGNHDLVKKISLEKCSTCQGCELEVFRCM